MISSLHNRHVQQVRKLSKRGVRDKTRTFVVEGAIGLEEALKAKAPLQQVVHCEASDRVQAVVEAASAAGVECLEVSREVMDKISDTTTPQGVVAVCRFVDSDPVSLVERPPSLSVVMSDVRDPGNAGTIMRTAWAVGADAIFVGSGAVDPYNSKVVRSAAGAHFNTPFAREADIRWLLDQLGDKKITRIGAAADAKTYYTEVDMTGPVALVFGNESWGLSHELSGLLDVLACIPMQGGAESLNVGIAAALFSFEAQRQRTRP